MKNLKQELIDFYGEMCRTYKEHNENWTKIRVHKYLKSINSPEPVERRAIGENEQAGKVCDYLCHSCGKQVGNTVFTVCDDCWDKKQTD